MLSSLGYKVLMLWICRKSFSFHHFPYMRQTWRLITISIHFVIGTTIMFSILGYMILMLSIYKKRFSFYHIFLINKGHLSNKTNLVLFHNLHFFVIGTTIMFSILGYPILKLWICKKSFAFHRFACNEYSAVK